MGLGSGRPLGVASDVGIFYQHSHRVDPRT